MAAAAPECSEEHVMTPQAAREHQATHAHGARLQVVVVDDHPM
jgi:hypothetical protein